MTGLASVSDGQANMRAPAPGWIVWTAGVLLALGSVPAGLYAALGVVLLRSAPAEDPARFSLVITLAPLLWFAGGWAALAYRRWRWALARAGVAWLSGVWFLAGEIAAAALD